ncbi:MAG: STAS domain-containing protein [Proteobacteria bacterium]|nr:MAG: STAS domain-containing protein [Pseudomonadota bacterium]
MASAKMKLPEIVRQSEAEILENWVKEQLTSQDRRGDLITESQLKSESQNFLRLFQEAAQKGDFQSLHSNDWKPVTEFLTTLSRTRAIAGFSPSETAQFVFSLKPPLFKRIRSSVTDITQLGEELSNITNILDRLGLFTTEIYLKSREEVIRRQQEDMLELSTPVVKLWDGILALPMIGTLDSARTQVVMETLLQRIVETGSEVAIIDITGVPHVDTLTAQHLLKTVTAARLMGADCIISGIRPQIAQTIVHLGVDLSSVITKSSLADAFQVALKKSGRVVAKMNPARSSALGTSRSTGLGGGTLSPSPLMDV